MNLDALRRRGPLLLVAALVLICSLVSPSAAVPAQESDRRQPAVPVLDWTDCGDGFQCATATVPLDYRRPRGETIELALVRKPALDQANRIGSLFLNPGGPGGSGVGFVRGAPPAAFAAVSRFDVVGWDPRGVGESRPTIDCGPGPGAAEFVFDRPQNVDPAALEARARAYGQRCLAANATLLSHMSTANVARDLDLLRAAVGDEQLNYLGFSYGTVIGATYATMFPGRARAMILDSPLDVEGYYDQPLENRHVQASGFENALDRFFMFCLAAGPGCGFGGSDPESTFDDLVARVDLAPLPSPDPAALPPLNGDLVLAGALNTMYNVSFWPMFAAALAAADAGDPGPMYDYLGFNQQGFGNDATAAVWSVDQRFGRRVDAHLADGEHTYGVFDHFWWLGGYDSLTYALWPVEDRSAFRGPVENPAGANPILVIGIIYDPATPFIGAERLTADLGNARLLTYQADGHGALTSLDLCLLEPFVDYLNDLTLPPEGARCVDQRPRFPSVAALTTSSAEAEPWLLDEPHLLPT